MLDTPVLFTVFNRYDTAKRVFEAIRAAKPRQLFVAADGPRLHKEGEEAKCQAVRELILSGIDWECEVYTLLRNENLGTGKAISEAITWFFSHVDKGIILEDDCLPESTFFDFAAKMLDYYESVDQVMHISGSSLQCGIKRGSASYYLSRMSSIWGWATWKRSWEKYSYSFFSDSESTIVEVLEKVLKNEEDVAYFLNEFKKVKGGVIDTWDYQWFYSLLKFNAVCVTPQYNLIQNLGFNSDGTHTFFAPYWYKYLVNKPINNIIYLKHSDIDEKADSFYMSLAMGRRTLETSYVKFLYRLKELVK
ncbi:nucleotide-diphospho-sugar transferase [Hymenobacter volaticus]|uniref:Nucleotide-diphospho-sugar transferase n=1 Tax=Hymenobacter volaticus TaxID=2932254 RepID=A0ABY4G8I6_9BACT|nr:nucleotide-diphospho-sugar transferase [Hymenobacter volaticus]UOQ67212.1 nucleotide-diphospho-sugar transferase [Hymenobacter volaticus]